MRPGHRVTRAGICRGAPMPDRKRFSRRREEALGAAVAAAISELRINILRGLLENRSTRAQDAVINEALRPLVAAVRAEYRRSYATHQSTEE